VQKEETSSLGLQFPDVPGFFSTADKMNDLMAETVSLWAEDETPPKPRCHVEWFEGNFQEYERDKARRLGEDSLMPSRIKYKKFER
jgi:hypothetical protein